MKNKVEKIEVKRLKRANMVYHEQSIVTNGIDFIKIKFWDSNELGDYVKFTFNKSMSKEFFRKLKKKLKIVTN